MKTKKDKAIKEEVIKEKVIVKPKIENPLATELSQKDLQKLYDQTVEWIQQARENFEFNEMEILQDEKKLIIREMKRREMLESSDDEKIAV